MCASSLGFHPRQGLWYSEDGFRRKRFRTQGVDARGYQVTREIPLRLGTNWHLVFALSADGDQTAQTHHLTIFQHVVDKVRIVSSSDSIRSGIKMEHPSCRS